MHEIEMLHIRKIFVRNDVNLEPNCNECYQHGVFICHELPQIDLVCITIIPQTNILMVTCPCELCDMCSRVALTHRIFPPSGAEGTTMCLEEHSDMLQSIVCGIALLIMQGPKLRTFEE
jgi:hypothetical protein